MIIVYIANQDEPMVEGKMEYPATPKPWDDLFALISFWTFVWGCVAALVFLIRNVLQPAGNTLAEIISVVVGLIAFLGVTKLIERKQRFKLALLTHRHLIVTAAAFAAGYFFYAYSDRNSADFKTQRAALQACAEFPQCIESAKRHGLDVGAYIDIYPSDKGDN